MYLDGLQLLQGGTRIDKALDFVMTDVLKEGHGDRLGVPDVVVLITDGKQDQGELRLCVVSCHS